MEKETWYKAENNKPEDRPEDWELPEGWKNEERFKVLFDQDMNQYIN